MFKEFARLLAGDGEQLKTDLSKCTNFFLITRWISYNTSDENENSSNNGELPSILTTSSVSVRRTVCALVDECTLDTNQIIEQQLNEKKMKDLPPASSPELAQSVDVSGKGDPCRFTGPTYSIEWWIEVNEKGEEIVNFLMKQKARKGRWWSAIGIGDNMNDMDIGTIFLENGEPKAMIDYFSNSYNLPIKDTKQDWKLNKKLSKWPKKLFVEDNNSEDEQIVELYFSRKITTEDENDRSMDDCVLFQFGANLGIYGPPGFRLHKHQDWPDLYKACKLKNHCMRHKRQNGGNDRNNFVNIPPLSHSIDENQTNNSNNVTDKAIELLMESLGPKIVQTVSESDKNETEKTKNKTKLIQKEGQKEEINEEDNNEIIKGKATIIPLLINSKQQSNNNGMQISEGNDVVNEKKNENKQNVCFVLN
uniref:DOMON domain-containing protein n=1 Tax=Meloidogyne incognita TaxID=6306 RepID=A0A914NA58_MELIC